MTNVFSIPLLPNRPLTIDYSQKLGESEDEEVRLRYTNWRIAVEGNRLSPWKTIPEEFAEYVKDYMRSGDYAMEVERVTEEAGAYAKSVELRGDGKDVWIFDIDETLLSNLPYYAHHGYGLEGFNGAEFTKWIEKGMAPAIASTLELYEVILKLGFKVFLLAGRYERFRSITIKNLMNVGYQNWDKLILRGTEEGGKRRTAYKSEKRSKMVEEGYRIVGNLGDQWSDLLGTPMSLRSFKLPYPMHYIP